MSTDTVSVGAFSDFAAFRDHMIKSNPVYQQWDEDRRVRQRIPLNQTFRGCVGFGARVTDASTLERTGRAITTESASLVPNSEIRFSVVRDLPPGYFRGYEQQSRRDVTYCTEIMAGVRYGLPVLDCESAARDSYDLRAFPYVSYKQKIGDDPWDYVTYPAEPGRFNEADMAKLKFVVDINTAMTSFAFTAREEWLRHRPQGFKPQEVDLDVDLKVYPRPLLGFPVGEFSAMYAAVSAAKAGRHYIRCLSCEEDIPTDLFFSDARRFHTVASPDGNWMSNCPSCRVRRLWYAKDQKPGNFMYHFLPDFRKRFCAAVAEGLPLRSPGDWLYCHRRQHGNTTIAHLFNSDHVLVLPQNAKVHAGMGQRVASGSVWAHAVPEVPRAWLNLRDDARWSALPELIGGAALEHLYRAWFMCQAVHVEETNQLLFPADLVSSAVSGGSGNRLASRSLYWDLLPCADYLHTGEVGSCDSLVFPPLPVGRWDNLKFRMTGSVMVNAGISDPRFVPPARNNHFRHRRRSR